MRVDQARQCLSDGGKRRSLPKPAMLRSIMNLGVIVLDLTQAGPPPVGSGGPIENPAFSLKNQAQQNVITMSFGPSYARKAHCLEHDREWSSLIERRVEIVCHE
jgi:hypothetical protein